MAYARRDGTSDIYFMNSGEDKFICLDCDLSHAVMNSQQAMGHLRAHRSRGDRVPNSAFSRLDVYHKSRHLQDFDFPHWYR